MENKEYRIGNPAPQALLWEQKSALGCLGMVALQEIHELLRLTLGSRTLGFADLGPAAPLLLFFVLLAGLGVMNRSRRGWWLSLLLMSGLGLLHLALFWGSLRRSLVLLEDRRVTAIEYEWLQGPTLAPFGLFWVIARSVLLLAVPLLLLLGELRKKVRST